MVMDYNNFAKTFSNSRKSMKWDEINYFLDYIIFTQNNNDLNWKSILDIWCWNWRFQRSFTEKFSNFDYLWIDISSELLKEAKGLSLFSNFLELDMREIDTLGRQFDYIFFIASFHHLYNLSDRIEVLKKVKKLLKKDWICFMTNWALNSEVNNKYNDSLIKNSKNEFWGLDYNIKIWEFRRFYHCFSIEELRYLFEKTWFSILENHLFKNWKNYISIVK